MALSLEVLRTLARDEAVAAWATLVDQARTICAAPLNSATAKTEVVHRDRAVGELDGLLATAAWDLWRAFEASVPRTADRLADWWAATPGGKAVLILDGLSLREWPWLAREATQRGFQLYQQAVTGAELPSATTEFAQGLGLASRASLDNNGAGMGHRLPGARTESVGLPWRDCARLVDDYSDWVFWHHWPDSQVHEQAGAGKSLEALTEQAITQLTGDEFWDFVAVLARGRRLVVTSDHGYAATGLFADATGEGAKWLKETLKSQRYAAGETASSAWLPPVLLTLKSRRGVHTYALGRRKWRSQSGYPTLAHGGLSLLEVLSPFLELSR
ncbi:MAG: hypothetical protein WAV07_13405 [Candidatus Contendobacter sp.]